MKRTKALLVIVAIIIMIPVAWHWLPNVWPITVPSFGGDYSIRLPHGYEIVRCSPGAVALVRPSSWVVISPPIDGYRIHGQLIIGHSRRWDAPGQPGYFVVDTRTGERWRRLAKDQWITVLRDHGISSAPPLVEPKPYSGLRARF